MSIHQSRTRRAAAGRKPWGAPAAWIAAGTVLCSGALLGPGLVAGQPPGADRAALLRSLPRRERSAARVPLRARARGSRRLPGRRRVVASPGRRRRPPRVRRAAPLGVGREGRPDARRRVQGRGRRRRRRRIPRPAVGPGRRQELPAPEPAGARLPGSPVPERRARRGRGRGGQSLPLAVALPAPRESGLPYRGGPLSAPGHEPAPRGSSCSRAASIRTTSARTWDVTSPTRPGPPRATPRQPGTTA